MAADLLGVFGTLVVFLRAAILCFQTIAVGGIIFLIVVAREFREESWVHRAEQVIRWSALALALAQLSFVTSNTLVLTSSANVTMGEAIGANYVIAGALAIVAALIVFFWPSGWHKRGTRLLLIPAAAMRASSVMTSHSASRVEDRNVLIAFTFIHYIATASWIGGLPYLLFVAKKATNLEVLARISQRFSRIAQISVALLFAAGLWLSIWYCGSL